MRVWIRKKGNNDDISRCREPMGGYGSGRMELMMIYLIRSEPMGGDGSGRKELIIIYLDAGSLWEGLDQEERN